MTTEPTRPTTAGAELPASVRDAIEEGRAKVQQALAEAGLGPNAASAALAQAGAVDPAALPRFDGPTAEPIEPDEAPVAVPLDPSTRHLYRFFRFDHLHPPYRGVSERCSELADWFVDNLPPGPERTVAIRKLLEAKDCAVRCLVPEDEADPS